MRPAFGYQLSCAHFLIWSFGVSAFVGTRLTELGATCLARTGDDRRRYITTGTMQRAVLVYPYPHVGL